MSYEVERKYWIEDERAIVQSVAALGGSFGPPELQADTYYAHPARDFAATDEALRIRRIGPVTETAVTETAIAETTVTETAVTETAVAETAVAETAVAETTVAETTVAKITYKGPKIDAGSKTRREIEIELSGGIEGARRHAELLEALGFRPVTEVTKHRRTATVVWQEHAVEIALDQVESLGTFVELETPADEGGLGAAEQCLSSLAARLSLTRDERRSYLELLLAGTGSRP